MNPTDTPAQDAPQLPRLSELADTLTTIEGNESAPPTLRAMAGTMRLVVQHVQGMSGRQAALARRTVEHTQALGTLDKGLGELAGLVAPLLEVHAQQLHAAPQGQQEPPQGVDAEPAGDEDALAEQMVQQAQAQAQQQAQAAGATEGAEQAEAQVLPPLPRQRPAPTPRRPRPPAGSEQ